MRITILTFGSRGDVQPYVALGRGLQVAGFQVRVAAHTHFRNLVEIQGLEFFAISGDPRSLLQTEAGHNWLETGRNPIRFLQRAISLTGPIINDVLEDCVAACLGADIILYPVLLSLAAHSISELFGSQAVPAYLQPVHPTGAYPFSIIPPLFGPNRLYNRLSHTIGERIFWRFGRPIFNRWRTKILHLPPYPKSSPFHQVLRQQPLCLYGFSKHVVAGPPEWGKDTYATGYWFLEELAEWEPPKGLRDFLASGPPPVYIGFGSMTDRDPSKATKIAIDALNQTQQRGVLYAGWGGLSNTKLPPHVYRTEVIPHRWLFPRMAAVVHHGGAGTCGASLAAGIPTIIIPFFGDQSFWGQRVQQLGAGPAPINRKRLTAQRLAQAIEIATSNEEMQNRAAHIGQQMQAEQGIDRAVALIQQYFSA